MAYGDVINMPTKASGERVTASLHEGKLDVIGANRSIMFSMDFAPDRPLHTQARIAQLVESSRDAGYQQALAHIRAELGIKQ